MSKQSEYEFTGVVERSTGNNNYFVRVSFPNDVEREVLCHLSGKMRQFKIKVLAGDEVRVTVPPPFKLGRITFRGKK